MHFAKKTTAAVRYGRQPKRIRSNVTIRTDQAILSQWKGDRKDEQQTQAGITRPDTSAELIMHISHAYSTYCALNKFAPVQESPFEFVSLITLIFHKNYFDGDFIDSC